MTEGEIHELEMMARDWADPGPVKTAAAIIAGLDDVSAMTAVGAARALPRLLEERKRLLGAVRDVISEEGDYACTLATEDRLRDAMDFAEESAT